MVELSVNKVVAMAIGLLLVGILFPIALDAIESFVPTDSTLVIVWPLIAVFAVLAVALAYIKSATD